MLVLSLHFNPLISLNLGKRVNRFFTYFSLFVFATSSLYAYEVSENTRNTENSPIEILTNAFSEVKEAASVDLSDSSISQTVPTVQAEKIVTKASKGEKKEEKAEFKTELNFDPKAQLGVIDSAVGEVDVQASAISDKKDENSIEKGNDLTVNPYVKNLSNAQALINRVGNIAKGPTNQLLNQVGLTPNLAKQVGAQINDAPKVKADGGMFEGTESKSSFGYNSSDKTASFGAISKPTGQSVSEQLQKTLDELKKKEEEKKIAEKKDQLGKDIKKFSDLKTPIAKEDYADLKKLFQDKDNVALLNEMQELDPNFLNNTNEAYYGKEGEGDHGVRDNDTVGKMPLLNFIEQFKAQIASNPEILKSRNIPSKNSFIPHERSRNDEAH